MKTLQKIASQYGLTLVPINYYCQGIKLKRKGYDLIDCSRTIYLSFEPCSYNYDGAKWKVESYAKNSPLLAWVKSLQESKKLIDETGFTPTGTTGRKLK
jgi:hypothetical protein